MNGQQLLALSPLLIVGATVVTVMLAIAFRRNHWWTATLTVTGLNLALLPLFMHFWFPGVFTLPLPQMVTPLLVIDNYAGFYMALILVAALATAALLHVYMEGYQGNREEIYLLLLLSALGGLGLVASRHFATFFLGLELLSVPMYGMAAYFVKERRSLEAGMKYLVLSAVASAFIAFGMALVYSQSGTLVFSEIGTSIANLDSPERAVMILGGAMLLIGIGFKLSLAPFHLWTPDVYEGAPAPVTAFLSTASKIAVFALLLRYFVEAHGYQYGTLVDALSVSAVLSIIIGNVLALQQENLKRLLAYSSIAHFGYLLVALIASGPLASDAVGIYLLTYMVTTLAAFGVITLMSSPYKEQDAGVLFDFRGLFWKRPWLAATLTVALLSLAGIPLTAGFIGKFYILGAGVDNHLWLLVAAVVFGSAVGLYYYLRALVGLFLRPRWVAPFSAPVDWARGAGGGVLILLMLAMLVLGVYPGPFISLVHAAGLVNQAF
jgi:NADH-quinone oxidoreductase subunit N